MKKINGFTLAEILITLTILGVVAAITVPALQKQNYKRTQISRMAKGYTVLEKVATNIAEKTGCVGKDLKCTGLLDLSEEDLRQKFIEYSGFRLSKESDKVYAIKPLAYKANPDADFGRVMRAFVTTPDSLAYSISTINITKNAPGEPNNHNSDEKAIRILVVTDSKLLYDFDWYKAASQRIPKNAIMGRNVFQFVIYDNFKVDPICTLLGGLHWPLSRINTNGYFKEKDINAYCDPNATQRIVNGQIVYDSCTCKIVHDGWKMNY